MSMMARFIAVTPDRLREVMDSPDLIEELFAPQAGAVPPELAARLQERLRQQAPQALSGMLERVAPELREQMKRRLGLAAGGPGDAALREALLKRLEERGSVLARRAPSTGAASTRGVSLDKAWHGVHYLLCGAAEPGASPQSRAVLGGTEIGEDQGYGPARFFSAAEAAEIARALQTPDIEAGMRARFDAERMSALGIYPGGWDADSETWLIDTFRTLRDFYAATSGSGAAVITLIE